jgi:hypothetical protein
MNKALLKKTLTFLTVALISTIFISAGLFVGTSQALFITDQADFIYPQEAPQILKSKFRMESRMQNIDSEEDLSNQKKDARFLKESQLPIFEWVFASDGQEEFLFAAETQEGECFAFALTQELSTLEKTLSQISESDFCHEQTEQDKQSNKASIDSQIEALMPDGLKEQLLSPIVLPE